MKIYIKIFIICIWLFSCDSKTNKINLPPYPTINKKLVTENICDTTVNDYYRNLENAEDSLVNNWYKQQGDYASNILSKISGKDGLAKSMQDLSNRKSYRVRRTNIVADDQYFFLKKMPNEKKFKLFYKSGYDGKDEFLYDPNTFKPETKHDYVINYIRPSWNGQYVVVALTYEGREVAEMIIIDMKTKKPLAEIIGSSWAASFYGVDWLPDNSGFTYLHFPNLSKNNKRAKTNTQAVLYKIGQNPKNITPIFSPQNNPELNLDITSYPIVEIDNPNQKYAIGYMVNVSNYFDAYYTEIENLDKKKVNWKPLFTKKDKVYKTACEIKNDTITFKSAYGASNYQIAQTRLSSPDFKSPTIIVPENLDEIIGEFKEMPNSLFFTTTKNGVQAKFYQLDKNEIKEIKLPKESGSISLRSYNNIDLFVTIRGWLNKSERYLYSSNDNKFTYLPLSPIINYPEFKDFIAKEIEVINQDGVNIPLSIIHHKDTELNGKNPVFIYGYGAYGDIEKPAFSPIFLTWVANGGVLCIAHVRGGGEKGEAWHLGGMKLNKPNSWGDLITCTEYLVEKKYSSPEHIALWSSSAGGIMAGRAVTDRPDLFKAVIIDAGVLNPIRREQSYGGSNHKEYGSMKDSIECKGVIAMDAYFHIKENVMYPAILLNAGMNDPRVAPWQSGKFGARLQEVNKSDNPILFHVDYDSGHGNGTTVGKVYDQWANIFSFAFWQTGHPDYQLDKSSLK